MNAKECGIKGYSKMNKTELKAILSKENKVTPKAHSDVSKLNEMLNGVNMNDIQLACKKVVLSSLNMMPQIRNQSLKLKKN